MEELVFPTLHFEYSFKKENERLFEKFGDEAIYTVPTTLDINAYEDRLRLVFNGQHHHYSYSLPISFDKKRYKKIYESLKKDGLNIHPVIFNKVLVPDVNRIEDIDFDVLSKEELIDYIKSGKTYVKDDNIYFDSKWFDLTYPMYPRWLDILKGKTYEARAYKTPNLFSIFKDEGVDYLELLNRNKDIVNNTLKVSGYNHLTKIVLEEVYLTKELTIYSFFLFGAKVEII